MTQLSWRLRAQQSWDRDMGHLLWIPIRTSTNHEAYTLRLARLSWLSEPCSKLERQQLAAQSNCSENGNVTGHGSCSLSVTPLEYHRMTSSRGFMGPIRIRSWLMVRSLSCGVQYTRLLAKTSLAGLWLTVRRARAMRAGRRLR
jgi:hypothetical protein